MKVRLDRIARIQAAMREQGWIAIVVLNHDDYRYLFGTDRAQPRAIIPFQGPPELVAFTGEEPELRARWRRRGPRLRQRRRPDPRRRRPLRELAAAAPAPWAAGGRHKVGMQMWFHTPAFLVDLFRQVNPGSRSFRRTRSWIRCG
jgi:Xaa-Pro aminopeptidase